MLKFPIQSYQRLENSEKIENEIIKPFLDWARTNVIQIPEITKLSRAFSIIGFVTGSAGVYAFFPLGGSFSITVSDFLKIDDNNYRKILYVLFATDAIIPMIALSGLATKNHFQKLASPSQEYKLITKKNKSLLRKGLISAAYLLGMFAAITPAYVTSDILKDEPLWLRVLMSIPAYLGGFMYKIDAEKRLLDKTFNTLSMGKTELIKNMRISLKNNLSSSISKIVTIENEQLELMFNEILEKDYFEDPELSIQEQTMHRIKSMFLNRQCSNAEGQFIEQPRFKKYSKKIASTSGFVIGAISSYTYYTLGEGAGLVICDWLGLSDPMVKKIISKFIASLVIVPWAALGAEATKNRFEQIYCSFFNKENSSIGEQTYPKLRKAIYAYSIFGGASAAIPLTYLAIKATEDISLSTRVMLVIPAFLGPAAVRTNAINLVLNQGLNWVNGFRRETSASKRDKLINAMSTISTALDKLPDEQITELYENIFKSNTNLLVNINNDAILGLPSETLNISNVDSDEATPLLMNKIN